MKIKILIDDHPYYEKGEHEVDDMRGNYLIRVGAAKEVKAKKDEKEKVEAKATKEKVENVKHTPKNEQ